MGQELFQQEIGQEHVRIQKHLTPHQRAGPVELPGPRPHLLYLCSLF